MIIEKNKLINIINYLICFYPLSFALGNLTTNFNTIVICTLGLLFFGKEIIKFDKKKIIILTFFLILFFSTVLNSFFHDKLDLNILYKSIFFFRYFILYIIIDFLIKNNKFNFKIFLVSVASTLLILAIDVLIQFTFGYNLSGLKMPDEYHASGIFGSELIFGGYITRLYFLTLCLIILIFQNKKQLLFNYFLIANILLYVSVIASGNKVPMLFYMFGLTLGFLAIKNFRILFLTNLVSCLIIFTIFFNFNNSFNLQMSRLMSGSHKIYVTLTDKIFSDTNEAKEISVNNKFKNDKVGYDKTFVASSQHFAIFLTSIDTMKENFIFGGGLKNYPNNCKKFYLNKNRGCGNHPHNYYLEILNDTGLIGFTLILIILFFILKDYYRNSKQRYSSLQTVYICLVLTLLIELFPIKSTGSFFSTGNATFIFLILGILSNFDRLPEKHFKSFKKIFNF